MEVELHVFAISALVGDTTVICMLRSYMPVPIFGGLGEPWQRSGHLHGNNC